MTEQSWMEYFKIKLAQLEESYNKQSSPNMSLLCYALKNNFLTPHEYLEWAQKHYTLPILSNVFFKENLNDNKNWNRLKDLYQWNIEVQPIASWEEHLIIGCLEVPPQFPAGLKPIFVLCDFNDLELSWNAKLSMPKTAPTPAVSMPPLPAKVIVPAPIATASDSTSFSALQTKSAGTKSGITKSTQKKNRYILNALFDKNSDLFNKKANAVFEKLKTHFEKSMILTLDAEEKNLHPYMWDKNFVATSDTNNAIPLETPSIFNIVHTTQKSFHGPVVLNSINEKFIDNWNQGTMPAHVTIVPLIINNRPAGVLLSIGESTCYTFGTLKFYENLTVEFANELSSIIESTAA